MPAGRCSNAARGENDLSPTRSKLIIAQQLRRNLLRADRLHTTHDEFSTDRTENRLIHAALRKVLGVASVADHRRLARELAFAFADVPISRDPLQDFQRLQLDRNMRTYREALDWARLILQGLSPTSAAGSYQAPSLLFPMEKLFETYVAKHFRKQLPAHLVLGTQVRRHHLVRHGDAQWFQLRPDMVISRQGIDVLVLDNKWKLLDAGQNTSTSKYGLNQGDFYQLHAYGRSYLGGQGVLALVYPRTDQLDRPLPVFDFSGSERLQLWVLPFCLKKSEVLLPDGWSWPEVAGAQHHQLSPTTSIMMRSLVVKPSPPTSFLAKHCRMLMGRQRLASQLENGLTSERASYLSYPRAVGSSTYPLPPGRSGIMPNYSPILSSIKIFTSPNKSAGLAGALGIILLWYRRVTSFRQL
ncbi:hypothetical protein VDG09_03170 [Xanthomonas campestris pv. raphani]|uniref:McrC family protein n=1 Tax=Xanthomonas campestris TaxID=339 RepID=UPI002B235E76|nr:hypothetical protein [Xanthomonas campestris]MEA9826665.1 hypothetical protein [Xanthomonas campestris pv. raphani]